jgi:malonyl-CoA O-methyltransferase
MLKEKIQQSFNAAAKTYDCADTLQKKVGNELIRQIKIELNNPVITDLGCGTGNTLEKLLAYFNCQRLYAVDFAEQLLELAKIKIKNSRVQFFLGDFEMLLFPENSIDLIFSNMALQWSLQFEKTIGLLYQQLTQKGVLAFSMPLYGTFAELKSGYKNTFFSMSYVEKILQEQSFKIISTKQEVYDFNFSSSLAALKSIKAVGANCLIETRSTGSLLTPAVLRERFEAGKNRELTYNMGYFVAEKG